MFAGELRGQTSLPRFHRRMHQGIQLGQLLGIGEHNRG